MAGRLVFAVSAVCIIISAYATAQEEAVLIPAEETSVPVENVFRLPQNVHPLHYKLRIVTHLDDEEGFKFTGKVWIKVSTISIDQRFDK